MKHTNETIASNQLHRAANDFLDEAISAGVVTESHIFYDNSAKKIVGYTDVTTPSDVRIFKMSDGSLVVTAEFEEPEGDVSVSAHLQLHQPPVVHERREVQSREHSTTLKRHERETAMAELAILISPEW